MTHSRVVGMSYRPSISVCRDMKGRIEDAMESVKSAYPVEAWLYQNDMMVRVELNVIMEERQSGHLEPALRKFRSLVGDPAYILPFSDFATFERTLTPEKKTKRKLRSIFRGKYVVDRTESGLLSYI